jgi:hypothetical protein
MAIPMATATMNICAALSPLAIPKPKTAMAPIATYDADDPCESAHPGLQGSVGALLGAHVLGYGAELGACARSHYVSPTPAAGDDTSGISHVHAVSERQILPFQRRGFFCHGNRLARQQRFVDHERRRGDQTKIGWDANAGFQEDKISRHQFTALHLAFAAAADHPRVRRDQLHKRAHGVLGTMLLHEADDRVEREHRSDHSGIDVLAQKQRDSSGDQQYVDQWTAKLMEKNSQRTRRRLLQSVGTMPLQASLDLRRV